MMREISADAMPPETTAAGLAEFLAAQASLLDSLHAQAGAERWGVSHQEFAGALYRSAAHRFGGTFPANETLEAYLRALHLEDLALVCALQRGSEAAWNEFVAQYRPVLYAAARAVVGAAGEARARELADSLYAELYGLDRSGAQRARSLLNYFHGRSKLSTWLRTVLAQRHVDALRAGLRTNSLDGEQTPQHVSAAGTHGTDGSATAAPVLGAPDRNRLLPPVRAAVSTTLAALPAPDRLLLSLYYLQDMTLAQIARLRGVHEATVSRQLDRLRTDLRRGIETALAAGRPAVDGHAAQRGLSPAEIKLCLAYVVEDWPFDLGRTLAVPSAPAPRASATTEETS
jgi:RNA polymerase sigma-70 factor, ECF subfamily